VTTAVPQGRIPREIVEFLNQPGGHSLIVKGPAGTGKTTFALQLTEELGHVSSAHYLSTRVSDASLFNQFPWLKERLKPSAVAVARKEPGAGMKVSRKALDLLTGKIERGEIEDEDTGGERQGVAVAEGFLEVDLGSDLPEVEVAYSFVEQSLPRRSLVLIDSIDALAERYGVAATRLINTIQQDLVENSAANVLYVLEGSGETRLDYLGDGVVSFASADHAGRRLRVMTIEKLRGQEVRQFRYLYTLDGGRLMAFDIGERPKIPKPQAWSPRTDLSKDAASTGAVAIDNLCGGLSRGRVAAFVIANGVPAEYVDWLRTAMICNFVAQGRGVAHVPPRKGTTDFLRELVSPYLASGVFEAHVRVFEPASLGHVQESANALPLEGSNVDTDLKWSNVEYRLPQSSRPFLSLMAFDTLESVYGDKVLEEMSGVLASIRRARDVFVGFATPNSASAAKLENLASVMIHVETVQGSVVLYGAKPYTGLFNLSFDWEAGVPEARLRPIV
jgi:KaiC/GvpD/RAD55 family RecA-like ATPase